MFLFSSIDLVARSIWNSTCVQLRCFHSEERGNNSKNNKNKSKNNSISMQVRLYVNCLFSHNGYTGFMNFVTSNSPQLSRMSVVPHVLGFHCLIVRFSRWCGTWRHMTDFTKTLRSRRQLTCLFLRLHAAEWYSTCPSIGDARQLNCYTSVK